MEPRIKEKQFDSVKFFRKVKERISVETEGMTYKEFKAYLEKHKKEIEEIKAAINAKHRDDIVKFTDTLNEYSREFAEKAMDENVAKALQGNKIV